MKTKLFPKFLSVSASFLLLTLVFSIPFAGLVGPIQANAQASQVVNSTNSTYGNTSNSMCISYSQDLSLGYRDSNSNYQVTALQRFLNNRGFLSVQPTGFFGSMTLQAVRNFQLQNGINGTGYVGQLTRAKIQQLACGTYPVEPIGGNGGTSQSPVISSVSGPTQLSPYQNGTWIINAYDANSLNPYFTQGNVLTYSVDWGETYGTYYTTNGSYQPNTVFTQTSTFTHSYSAPGTYTIRFTVKNAYNLQAVSTITVTVGNGGTVYPPYPTPLPTPTPTPPPSIGLRATVTSVSPQTAKVGDYVTVYGSNFYSGENTIYFNDGFAAKAYSNNGYTLTFQVPSSYSPYCPPGAYCITAQAFVSAGIYNVKVGNSYGMSAASVPLTIAGGNGGVGTGAAPTITAYSANTSTVDSEYRVVTLQGTGFTQSNTIYVNGVATYFNVPAVNNQVQFTVYRNPANNCNKYACTDVMIQAYNNFTVVVENQNGKSNQFYIDLNSSTY